MPNADRSMDRSQFHLPQPDYLLPILTISAEQEEKIKAKLDFLYGRESLEENFQELYRIIKVYYAKKSPQMLEWEKNISAENRFTEQDIILITYGDLIREKDRKPLETMRRLAQTYLKGVFNTLHILPFFPYSSDRGFAVMDFEEVDPALGSWDDILSLKGKFKLMFDGVFNHVSAKSRWFQEFLNQNPQFMDFFTGFSTKSAISPDHLKLIVRPRTSDILSSFETLNGSRMVWTTFSDDQIDLNYKNPKVLLKMIEILLYYVWRGADLIRLDAVTYLWEELGTNCVHLEQSHIIIRLFRDILDIVAPHVALITETNVPHEDNVKYFSKGHDEAQMVYNFALPPLVLHTFITSNSKAISDWAASLKKVSNQATYFNFLDSHDGIGVMAVKSILSSSEIETMALTVLEHGGYISYKDNGDGSSSPYELNITWWNAINNDDDDDDIEFQVQRYIASRAIALVLMGVPGIYLHGLLGSRNDADLVLEEKQTRSINRKNIKLDELMLALKNKRSTTTLVTGRLIELIRIRNSERAFHPNSDQKILAVNDNTFSVLRHVSDLSEKILCIINISPDEQVWKTDINEYGLDEQNWTDVITKKEYHCKGTTLNIKLYPYQIIWLKNK